MTFYSKTTLYLLIVTLLALLLNLVLVVEVLHFNSFLTLLNIESGNFIILTFVLAVFGAIVSFLFSEMIARLMLGVTLIDEPSTYLEKWLFSSVHRQSRQLGIVPPQIGIFYTSGLNAFTTGWAQKSAMFAISSGLLESLDESELDAVIGHELSHIESGDMVSLALSQGLVVSITALPARLFGFFLDYLIFRRDSQGSFFYNCTYWFCFIVAGALPHFIAMWFSRQREFSADHNSARLNGTDKMVSALQRLSGGKANSIFSKQTLALGLSGVVLEGLAGRVSRVTNIFSSHPPLNKRVYALKNNKDNFI